MVNNINTVAFKINENVLDFILKNNNEYNFFTFHNYIHPLTLKSKLNSKEKKELEAFYSKKYLEQNILGLATLFRDVPSFYLPVQLDYRGRLYCMSEYLNYQGIDLAKSLLEFSQGTKVYLSEDSSIKYLKIFGANCFGNKIEKKSFIERIDFINENIQDIINFDNGILLQKAENKLLFLSFCFEFKKYIEALNNKEEFFITHLPIQFDASCNGFQHLTLLIDDIALSKELNLSDSSWDDVPKDFYSFVGLNIKNYFYNQLNNSNVELSSENKVSFDKLSRLDIHRSLIKKAVMTIPYNASALSIVNYIKDEFEQKKNPLFNKDASDKDKDKNNNYYLYVLRKNTSVIFTELDFQNLRKALNLVIFIKYPKLTNLVNYLKSIAKISNSLNIPIPWILPTGLVVKQQFYATKTIKVKPFIYNKNLLNLTITKKNEFNKLKQKTALMPNLVHSLDAASLCIVINNYFNQGGLNKNFYSIHDCFAVPCNKVSLITELLKVAYCIIYSNNKYLIEFDSNFILTIKNFYGEKNVSINDNREMIVINDRGPTKFNLPSINSILDSDISSIDFSKSSYIAH